MPRTDGEQLGGADRPVAPAAPGGAMADVLTRFAAMLRNSDELVAITDLNGCIVYLSPAVERVVGWRQEELLGRLVVDMIHHEDLAGWASHRGRLLANPATPARGEVRARGGDGTWRWLQVVSTDLSHVPAVGGVVHNVRDVTDTRQAQGSFDAVVGSLGDTVARFDRDLRHVFVNDAVHTITGVAAEAFLGRRHRDIPWLEPGLVERWEQALRLVLATGQPHDLELDYEIGGETRWLWSRLTAEVGPSGEVEHVVVVGRDVTERRESERRAAHDALHDPLTGLANRALLLDRLDHALAARPRDGQAVAVLFCDLDRLKLVNDSLGHAGGDALLVAVADRLRALVRPSDTVARLGGDEFVVAATVEEGAGEHLGERIVEALRVPFALDGGEAYVSGSVGLAVAGADATAAGLLADADAAMYEAKRRGGSRVRRSPGRAGSAALDRLTLERDLHAAVDRDELALRFRPVVSLAGAVVGAEAELRWHHPSRGVLDAAAFAGALDEPGLATAVGSWSLAAAARQAAAWPVPITTWVAVSQPQVAGADVVSTVSKALADTGLPRGALGLLVAGEALLDDAVPDALRAMAELGVRVVVTGLGDRPVPLTTLRRLPLDGVRLDASLLTPSAPDVDAGAPVAPGADLAIVAAMVDLARTFGLTVVVEGVRTDAQLEALRQLGCDGATGPLVAPALAGDELARRLAARPRPPRLESPGNARA